MLDPLGVVSGMVFSVATRASREVRSKWIESIGRDRVARLPSGLNPVPHVDKSLRQFLAHKKFFRLVFPSLLQQIRLPI